MLAVGGSFAVIPYISAYIQFNHGYPRDALGQLYLFGGIVSFIVMQLAGYLADRFTPALVACAGGLLMALALLTGFVFDAFYLPVVVVFMIFMSAQGIRNVAVNALTSRLPAPHERASYQSAQSAVQSLAMALGGFLATTMLHQLPNHKLAGMPQVAMLALGMGISAPLLLTVVQAMLARSEAPAAAMASEATDVDIDPPDDDQGGEPDFETAPAEA